MYCVKVRIGSQSADERVLGPFTRAAAQACVAQPAHEHRGSQVSFVRRPDGSVAAKRDAGNDRA
jgi:hypothetical protein